MVVFRRPRMLGVYMHKEGKKYIVGGNMKYLDESLQKEMIALVQKMIKIPSFTQHEETLANFLHGYMEAQGYDDVQIDEYGNVLGVIHGDHEGPRLLFDGHIDTVEIGDENAWDGSPFSGDIVEGKLYGRGASDMKGALGAMIYAANHIDRETLHGSVYVSGTVNEEVAEGATLTNILEIVKPDLVIIGESSDLKVNIGQRGRAEIFVQTIGQRAHSANPHIGINAVKKMVKALNELSKHVPAEDPLLGLGVLEITDIISAPFPGASVVPELCEVTFDRRLIPGDNHVSIIREMEELLDKVDDEDFKYNIGIRKNDANTWTGKKLDTKRYAPAWKFSEEEPFIQRVIEVLEKDKLYHGTSAYSFCTNGSASAGELDIPTIGYGPGDETQAHTVNEHIDVAELMEGCQGYLALMQHLGKQWGA